MDVTPFDKIISVPVYSSGPRSFSYFYGFVSAAGYPSNYVVEHGSQASQFSRLGNVIYVYLKSAVITFLSSAFICVGNRVSNHRQVACVNLV